VSPRRVLLLFSALMLLPLLAIVWLGWQYFEQDRILEERRVQVQREKAADVIVTAFQQAIAADEKRLAETDDLPSLARDGARVIVIKTDSIHIYPPTPLPFQPSPPSLPEASEDLFQAGEVAEFLSHDYPKAIAKFRELATRSDRTIQAAALLGLARNQRKAFVPAAALDTYAKLSKLEGVAVLSQPADLVARGARCSVLEELGRSADLRHEAEQLQSDLLNRRWLLKRGTYFYYLNETNRWLGLEDVGSSTPESTILAEQVNHLWETWDGVRGSRSPVATHEILPGAEPGAILWRASSDGLVALVASPNYVKTRWRTAMDSLLASQSLQLLLEDPNIQMSKGPLETARAVNETGLPWNLIVKQSSGPADSRNAASRRRMVLAGLALLVMMVVVASYFVARVVKRELELARLQSDFVSAVSHEFRTPLTSLSQATEILSDGRVSDPDQQRKFYNALARATGRLRRLVESLLEFGRMEAGRTPYRMETLDASALVRSIVEDFQNESEIPTHTIEVRSNGLAPVEGDREALGRALRNLLDNAVKYSPDSQKVQVEVSPSNGCVAISVKDSGIGIPRHEHQQIFRKFVRGSDAKHYGIKGTGVGLAMVEHIVQGHGAEIRVESEPGHGSTFTILLRAKNGKNSHH
jgi:signal transduction histidine kinase